MKRIHPSLLISSAIILAMQITVAQADDTGNPWSPSYNPQANNYPTPPPPPRYTPGPDRRFNQAPPRPPQQRGYANPWQQQPQARRNTNPPPQASRPPQRPPVQPDFQRPPRTMPPPGWRPYNGPSAFNTPGYNPYNDRWGRGNNFWGRSGPSTWMHPSKRNLEQGWDDMLNAPSRMGEMPGGWTAPSVSVPNPIDIGDQVQENVKDLPDQMRNMDVGN